WAERWNAAKGRVRDAIAGVICASESRKAVHSDSGGGDACEAAPALEGLSFQGEKAKGRIGRPALRWFRRDLCRLQASSGGPLAFGGDVAVARADDGAVDQVHQEE